MHVERTFFTENENIITDLISSTMLTRTLEALHVKVRVIDSNCLSLARLVASFTRYFTYTRQISMTSRGHVMSLVM